MSTRCQLENKLGNSWERWTNQQRKKWLKKKGKNQEREMSVQWLQHCNWGDKKN